MREAWRLNAMDLRNTLAARKGSLAVFLIYIGNDLPDLGSIERSVKKIVRKFADESTAPLINSGN